MRPHPRTKAYLASTCAKVTLKTPRRTYISNPLSHQPSTPHIAILGGGITGLSAAYHLSRKSRDPRITVLEVSSRLGGWVNTERISVDSFSGPSSIVLEVGPRTLRPNSKAVLELINFLQLENELIAVPKTSLAARNRFLYINGFSDGLTTLPTPLSIPSFWKSPVGPTLISAVLEEYWTVPNRSTNLDESVDSFLTRRFGNEVARIFASSMTHGIYAADARKLSVRAAFPSLWDAESQGAGSVVWGFLKQKRVLPEEEYQVSSDLQRLMEQVSVYSFKHGLSTLTNALVKELKKHEGVNIKIADGVASVDLGDPFIVRTNSGDVLTPTHIISALPIEHLRAVLRPSRSEPSHSLDSILSSGNPQSSSVYVTNLVFPPTSKPIHPAGFGYLIPRPPEGYSSAAALEAENGQGMLGVIFDSVSLNEQDSAKGYTKMTVMSGGPYMLSRPAPPGVGDILQSIRAHLGAGYEVPDPIYTKVTECRECIPLYGIGHLDWVKELKDSLQPFGERLQVIGASIGGVSIPGCVEQGRRAANRITLNHR